MTDVAMKWDNLTRTADLSLVAGDLAADTGMESAVTLSLFTDRRVSKDDAERFGVTDRRGWWGDGYPDVDADELGSRLWLLKRAKIEPETLRLARDFAIEALTWMVEDGAARSVDATVERGGLNGILLTIAIARPDGTSVKYNYVWEFGQHE
jgi:phage gp46-like protein